MLFVASCFSYGDRVALSIAGPAMQKLLSIDAVKLGYLLSGFGWAYVLGQLPSGGLLDRFGSKRVYGMASSRWTVFAFLIGFAGYLPVGMVFGSHLRPPALLRPRPGADLPRQRTHRGRLVPHRRTRQRLRHLQRLAVLRAGRLRPALRLAHSRFGWRSCFWFMGLFGVSLAFAWWRLVFNVNDHPLISPAEIDSSSAAAASSTSTAPASSTSAHLDAVSRLLSERMLVGIYIGQFCINTLTWFFITWFPVYLVQARHMSILKGGFGRRAACAVRLPRRRARRRLLRPPAPSRLLPHLRAQAAHHRRHAAFGDHDRLQLHSTPSPS